MALVSLPNVYHTTTEYHLASPVIGIHLPQLSGTLLDKMQGLAKLHAAAKAATNFELGQLTETKASAGKDTSAHEGSSISGAQRPHSSDTIGRCAGVWGCKGLWRLWRRSYMDQGKQSTLGRAT